MSRKENCLDNSLAENFFGLLKSELFYIKEYKTIEELEKDIIEYIDYYNNKRIKGKLKGMSPVQYRVHSQVAKYLIKKCPIFWVQYIMSAFLSKS